MKMYFTNFRTMKERISNKKMEVDRQAIKRPFHHSKESEEVSTLDDEAQIQTTIRVSLDDQWQLEEMARHRAQYEPLAYESGLGSMIIGGESEFRRTSSVRETINRGSSHITSMLETFGSGKRSFREISSEPLSIIWIHMPSPIRTPSNRELAVC